MPKKLTKKDLIVNFVAQQGKRGARYTEIQKFIYEHNNPGMTYDSRWNRGYYSSGFSSWNYNGSYNGTDRRYLLKGDTCLIKLGELYFAKKNGKILQTPQKQEVVWED